MREYVRFSKHRKLHYAITELLDLLESTLILVFCTILVFTYVVCLATVQGDSMVPTLEDQEQLLVLSIYPEPACGDIIIANSQEAVFYDEAGGLCSAEGLGKSIVKRVIATAGQTVDITEDGHVVVDNLQLSEPYIDGDLTAIPTYHGAFTYPVEVPEGYVFVLGDNRSISKDSRYADVGFIPLEDVEGKVIFRFFPFDRIGTVA